MISTTITISTTTKPENAPPVPVPPPPPPPEKPPPPPPPPPLKPLLPPPAPARAAGRGEGEEPEGDQRGDGSAHAPIQAARRAGSGGAGRGGVALGHGRLADGAHPGRLRRGAGRRVADPDRAQQPADRHEQRRDQGPDVERVRPTPPRRPGPPPARPWPGPRARASAGGPGRRRRRAGAESARSPSRSSSVPPNWAATTAPSAATAIRPATRAIGVVDPRGDAGVGLVGVGEHRRGQRRDAGREAEREDQQRRQQVGDVVRVGADALQQASSPAAPSSGPPPMKTRGPIRSASRPTRRESANRSPRSASWPGRPPAPCSRRPAGGTARGRRTRRPGRRT